MTEQENEKKAFNPWPYGLIAALLAFCTIQFSLVTIATTSFEGLEDVEYYRHGVEYGKEIERKQKQQDLEWTIAHNLNEDTVPSKEFPLRVALLDHDKKPIMHAKAKVKVGRPATLRDDRVYEMKEVGPGVYSSQIDLGSGNWRLDFEIEKGENLVKVEYRHKVAQQTRAKSQEIAHKDLP